MSITPTTITPAETLPSSNTELWAPAAFLRPDWGDGVKVRTAWQTRVINSKNVSEQRYALLVKPTRTVTVNMLALKSNDLSRMTAFLRRAGYANYLMPLFSDFTVLTATASSGTAILTCDTTTRRFFQDARVLIVRPNGASQDEFEIHQISSLTDSQITLTANLSDTYLSKTRVYPLVESRIDLVSEEKIFTDSTGSFPVESIENVGGWNLEPSIDLDTVPAGFNTHDGYPIFNLTPAYDSNIRLGFARMGSFSTIGTASVATVYGERVLATLVFDVNSLSRAAAWKAIQFFDSRGGRAYPFWMPSFINEHELVSADPAFVVVEAVGAEKDWDFRPYIFVTERDNTIHIRTVTGVTRTTASGVLVDIVFFDTSISGLTTSTTRMVGTAYLMRFASDELVENWITDSVMQTTISTIELLQEGDLDAGLNLTVINTWSAKIRDVEIFESPTTEVCYDVDGTLADTRYVDEDVLTSLDLTLTKASDFVWEGTAIGVRHSVVYTTTDGSCGGSETVNTAVDATVRVEIDDIELVCAIIIDGFGDICFRSRMNIDARRRTLEIGSTYYTFINRISERVNDYDEEGNQALTPLPDSVGSIDFGRLGTIEVEPLTTV